VYDLIIIGGGPAGTSAAITAASEGANVLLLERGRLPRQKVCGEFVSAESLDLLKHLLAPEYANILHDAIRIPSARLFVDGRVLHAPIAPAAASIARFDLDSALWESAAKLRVEALQQATVQEISGSGPFHVATSVGEFAAQAVINATGRWSNLNPGNGSMAAEKWLGLKAHFAESSPPASVDLYFFAGGYCGVQPVALAGAHSDPGRSDHGRVNACAMVRADVANTLDKVFALHPALQERSSRWEALMEPVSTSPLIFREPEPERDGILMVGDAAGFVDPFVGDGISLALRSGALAAQSLMPFVRRGATLEQSMGRYRKEYSLRLAPVFRTSSRIRKMLLFPQALRKPALSVLERVPALTRFLVSKTR
jgi:menaquinone-9 beta-reductase